MTAAEIARGVARGELDAVEVVERGRRRVERVEPGLTADGLVAVEGDLREGQKVVVPA